MRLTPAILSPITLPSYNRNAVSPGILHIGVGNFHKAHQAYYIDEVMNKHPDNPEALQWGIIGASLFDGRKRDALEPQGYLQTLVARDALGTTAQILGSMIDYLPYDESRNNLYQALIDPEIKIVSLTVTEGGYFLTDEKFDPKLPEIQHDVKHPDAPLTSFGVIIKALDTRRKAGIAPFTVMCCDNLPENGKITRSVTVGLANLIDKDLGQWIDENVAFPNSMVDRITPSTTKEGVEFVKDTYGIDDAMPVFCEPFCEWIMEDEFCNGRPPFESIQGITFVNDVTPYELKKIRILNGGHASLCYPTALLGLEFVHDAMKHPTIGPFLDALEKHEIIPTVPPVPDRDLLDYWKLIGKRFSNPTIKDTISRICYDGSSRQPKFIVPVIADNIKLGRGVEGMALVSAMWCRYCQGKTEDGQNIGPNDPHWDTIHATAKAAQTDPQQWLAMRDVYGDVGQEPAFVEAFGDWLQHLEKKGVVAAMRRYTESKAGLPVVTQESK